MAAALRALTTLSCVSGARGARSSGCQEAQRHVTQLVARWWTSHASPSPARFPRIMRRSVLESSRHQPILVHHQPPTSCNLGQLRRLSADILGAVIPHRTASTEPRRTANHAGQSPNIHHAASEHRGGSGITRIRESHRKGSTSRAGRGRARGRSPAANEEAAARRERRSSAPPLTPGGDALPALRIPQLTNPSRRLSP